MRTVWKLFQYFKQIPISHNSYSEGYCHRLGCLQTYCRISYYFHPTKHFEGKIQNVLKKLYLFQFSIQRLEKAGLKPQNKQILLRHFKIVEVSFRTIDTRSELFDIPLWAIPMGSQEGGGRFLLFHDVNDFIFCFLLKKVINHSGSPRVVASSISERYFAEQIWIKYRYKTTLTTHLPSLAIVVQWRSWRWYFLA